MSPAPPLLTAAEARGPADRPLLVTGAPDLLDDLLRLAEVAGVNATVATDPVAVHRAWARAPLVIVCMDRAEACVAAGLPYRPHVVLVGDQVEDRRVWSAGARLGADHVVFLPAAESWLVRTLAEFGGPTRRASTTIGVVAGRRGSGASTLSAALALAGQRHGLDTMLVDADPRGSGLGTAFARLMPAVEGTPRDHPRPTGRPAASGNPPAGYGELSVVYWDQECGPELPTAAMETLLTTASSTADLVIIDLPWQPDPAAALALEACRTTLVVLRADPPSIPTARRVCSVVQRRCRDVRTVVRTVSSAALTPAKVSALLGAPLAGVITDGTDPAGSVPSQSDPSPGAARPPAPGPPLGDRLLAGLGILDSPVEPGEWS
ncbi:septum site-determining protein Ssd [Frankia sp. AgKG'84/4]|uniref:septum site-determining protein Ssd n=1 Tax=Frankia sp. AgKG'84/4 TaxID=573490 RepID=UPI00200F1A5C|nr:septum site-determining protein Ssd [Frankia sp. AgKG'84/4]MCL9796511.1 CpaE-like family protein [Frankia sp. AgKG'84/4]